MIPGLGPVTVLGPLVGGLVGALGGAVVVGGLSALGAGLYSIGIPRDSIVEYETAPLPGPVPRDGARHGRGGRHSHADSRQPARHTSPPHQGKCRGLKSQRVGTAIRIIFLGHIACTYRHRQDTGLCHRDGHHPRGTALISLGPLGLVGHSLSGFFSKTSYERC